MRRTLLVATLACLAGPTAALGAAGTAVRHVQEGIERFRQANYKEAAQAFADADVALPDDPTIAFDQACVKMAQGDTEQAVELLKTAALCRTTALAGQAHYNLGCLKAGQAKAVFGDKPEEAAPEVRQEGMAKLVEAIGHFRDCLQVDPNHTASRHNLEVLRLWLKTMQDAWSQRDRQKQQAEMNLLQWLKMIQAEQRQLRESVRALAAEADSPRRRQAASDAATAQGKLADQIDPLKEKIASTLRPPTAQGSAPNQPVPQPPGPDADRAVDLLTGLADQSATSMQKAADRIAKASWEKAATRQTEALDALNEIYMAVAPFADVLQTAVDAQQQLIDRSAALVEPGARADADHDDAEKGALDSADIDYDALTAKQRRVERWSEILPLKAKQQLKSRADAGKDDGDDQRDEGKDKAKDQTGATAEGKAPADAGAGKKEDSPPLPPAAEADAQQALATALHKAVELGPKIQQLAGEAATELAATRAAGALPKQQEALKLLEQIAESLPKQKQESQSPQQPRQNQQESPPKEQSASGKQPKQQQPKEQPRKPRQNPSQQQAEAVLSKARERERQHRRLQKQLQGYLRSPVRVDKDW